MATDSTPSQNINEQAYDLKPMIDHLPKKKLWHINTFIFDVDGVLTDGTVIALDSGEQARTFFVKDGWAITNALKKGYNVCIISGGGQLGTEKRLQFLGITDIFLNAGSKSEVYAKYCSDKKIDPERVLYMGDDLPDLNVMLRSGISTCPKDAARDILEISNYISPFNGGKGAVRDVIEQVMRIQDKWRF